MIVVDGLTKRFGEQLAVDDVSFEARPGQVVGFLGHNGAGKTTTLRMLLGHVTPTAGHGTILGKPIGELDRPLRHIGVLFESGLHPGRTARNHLKVSAATGGLDAGRIDPLLELVGLEEHADRRAGGFSSGMKQRLGIATALLADPEVVILDEPATGLDPEGIRWLRTLLRRLADDGRTVLVSSHQLAEVAQTVDHVVVMDRGVVVARSSLGELIRRAGTEVVVRSPGAEVLSEELRAAGIATRVVSGEEVRARDVPSRVVSELAVATGVPIWEIRAEEPSLEEAFFELTQEGRARTQDGSEPDDDGAGPSAEEEDAPAPDASEPTETEGEPDPDDPVADAERRIDRELERLRPPDRPRIVAVVAPAPGLGRTTLSFLLADVLAAGPDWRTLAVSLSCDRERLNMPIPQERRSALNLSDLVDDLDGFDEAARLSPYLSNAHSGAHALTGPRRDEQLRAVTPEQLDALLDFAGRFHDVIVADVGDLAEPTLRALVRRADQVVLLGAPDAADALADSDAPVLDAIEAERSERATVVLNRVDERRVATFAGGRGAGSHSLIPRDRDLIRALDAGDFRLDQVRPETRVALKRLALSVAEGLT